MRRVAAPARLAAVLAWMWNKVLFSEASVCPSGSTDLPVPEPPSGSTDGHRTTDDVLRSNRLKRLRAYSDSDESESESAFLAFAVFNSLIFELNLIKFLEFFLCFWQGFGKSFICSFQFFLTLFISYLILKNGIQAV